MINLPVAKRLLNTVSKNVYGQKNDLVYTDSIMKSVSFNIQGNNNKVVIRKSCVLHSLTFHIEGDNHSIEIGEGCHFEQGGVIWIEDSQCALTIGDGSTFENVSIALTEPGSKVTIGRDCMFSYNIDLRTGDSHSIIDVKSRERANHAKDIAIGDHVWVAARSSILKGVSIANNSVVGMGAVVTRPFSESGVVLAGNPARIVKSGITWSRERI